MTSGIDAHAMPAGHRTPQWVSDLIDQVLKRLNQATEANSALALSQWLATFLWKNNTGVYRLDDIETALLRHCPTFETVASGASASDAELHVATEVYPFGGHTSLMRQLILTGPENACALLTGMNDRAVAASRLGLAAHRIIMLEPSTDPWQRIAQLAQAMSGHEQVILHIHPNDLLSALAVRLLKQHTPNTRVSLVNHADHAFSVGVGAVDRILEISRYGWSLRADRGSKSRSTFIGIPIAQPESIANSDGPSDEIKLLSGGSAYKYKPVPGMSLPATFGKLLRQHPNFRVTVIGPSKRDWWWWPLRLSQGARFNLTQLMPKDAYMALLRSCTIYVDSHPLLGGTAFPEALMRGCRVAGIRGLAWGYSPADELCSDSEATFMRQCAALAKGEPKALQHQQEVRARCVADHAPTGVRERLSHAMVSDELLPPPNSTIPEPSAEGLEREWHRKGQVLLPSRKECPLTRDDRLWLTHQFAHRAGGLRSRSTWTLLRLALTTHR